MAKVISILLLLVQIMSGVTYLKADDFLYLGSFKVPPSSLFNYSGSGLAVSGSSLYIVGNINAQPQQVAELVIPSLGQVAVIKQTFTDPTEGKWIQASVPGTPTRIGGMLIEGSKLCGTLFANYDGGTGTQAVSHWCRPGDLSNRGNVEGINRIYDMANQALKARFFGGWLGWVPVSQRTSFGNSDIFTGQCCITNSSTTSNGPAVWMFNSSQFQQNTPSKAGFYYTDSSPLGTGWNTTNSFWNGITRISGAFWKDKSVLFFGTQGIGEFCYGIGGTVPPTDPNIKFCYDPVITARGGHAYPYFNQVWAYNSDEFDGSNSVRPYAIWTLSIPGGGSKGISGLAFDYSSNKLYIAEPRRDVDRPIVHVWQVQ